MLIQRIFASVLLLVCAGLALMAWPYQAAFSYEPVGPRAFPLLMLGLMGLALLYMAIRPAPIVRKDDEPELDRETLTKIGLCIGRDRREVVDTVQLHRRSPGASPL